MVEKESPWGLGVIQEESSSQNQDGTSRRSSDGSSEKAFPALSESQAKEDEDRVNITSLEETNMNLMSPDGQLDQDQQPLALTLNMQSEKDAQAHRSNQIYVEEDQDIEE